MSEIHGLTGSVIDRTSMISYGNYGRQLLLGWLCRINGTWAQHSTGCLPPYYGASEPSCWRDISCSSKLASLLFSTSCLAQVCEGNHHLFCNIDGVCTGVSRQTSCSSRLKEWLAGRFLYRSPTTVASWIAAKVALSLATRAAASTTLNCLNGYTFSDSIAATTLVMTAFFGIILLSFGLDNLQDIAN